MQPDGARRSSHLEPPLVERGHPDLVRGRVPVRDVRPELRAARGPRADGHRVGATGRVGGLTSCSGMAAGGVTSGMTRSGTGPISTGTSSNGSGATGGPTAPI